MLSGTLESLLSDLKRKEREVLEIKTKIAQAVSGVEVKTTPNNRLYLKSYILKALKDAEQPLTFALLCKAVYDLGYSSSSRDPRKVITQRVLGLRDDKLVAFNHKTETYTLTDTGVEEAADL